MSLQNVHGETGKILKAVGGKKRVKYNPPRLAALCCYIPSQTEYIIFD